MQYQKPVILQEQRLKMNAQLYQSIQLMAMPIQDLRLRIQEEIDKNPALEVLAEKNTVSLDARTAQPSSDYDAFENSSDPGYSKGLDYEATDRKHKFIEGVLSRGETLHDHLLWQLRLQPIDQVLFTVGELLIQNLDANGFHREKLDALLSAEQMARLNEILPLLRGFEPVGTCCADYRESLKVQAALSEVRPAAFSYVNTVIDNELETLEKHRFADIAKRLKIQESDVEELFHFIKTLNPFPGRQFSSDEAKYVIPDLMVRLKDGEFVLIINDEEIPVLGINPYYHNLLKNKEERPPKEVKQFISNHVKDAKWFIRSIHQRKETLVKIAKAIVEFQRDFFLKGPKYLVPLTRRDIANTVEVHETTVSRITTAKYIQTEWGIFELKYFFSNSISGSGSSGSRFSKQGVKQVIKEIIEEHTDGKRLSDQKISDLLQKKGINIARRTVAKYRKELDIMSSYDR
ncbi:MAG: RNA polymerase factor sigma-54 [Spirochaetales bacterium]|nr:RNA polymerase factor sigma-54 [Spirochaetales bacterium]